MEELTINALAYSPWLLDASTVVRATPTDSSQEFVVTFSEPPSTIGTYLVGGTIVRDMPHSCLESITVNLENDHSYYVTGVQGLCS